MTLGGLDKLSLDNQSGNAPDVMMAPYDRVGSLGSDGQLSEVKLSDGAKTDDTTKSLVTLLMVKFTVLLPLSSHLLCTITKTW